MTFQPAPRAMAVMVIIAMLGGVACAGAVDADPTPVKTFKITPASGEPRTTPTPPPIKSSEASDTPATGSSELTIAGRNILFDKEKLEAQAGAITIEFDNQDGGVPHNFAVYRSASDLSNPIGATTIENGPVKQQLRLDLQPGEYFYQCDVHPTTMTGALTVR